MFREEGEHVVEERNTGGNGGFTGAIDIELEVDFRFSRDPFDLRPSS